MFLQNVEVQFYNIRIIFCNIVQRKFRNSNQDLQGEQLLTIKQHIVTYNIILTDNHTEMNNGAMVWELCFVLFSRLKSKSRAFEMFVEPTISKVQNNIVRILYKFLLYLVEIRIQKNTYKYLQKKLTQKCKLLLKEKRNVK